MNFLNNIPRTTKRAKFFLLVLEAPNPSGTANILYSGVHFSLEEAYSAAKKELAGIMGKDDNSLSAEMKSWEIITAKELEEKFEKAVNIHQSDEIQEEPEGSQLVAKIIKKKPISEIAKGVKAEKKKLMEKIIEDQDLGAIEVHKNLLTSNEKKLLKERILFFSQNNKSKK